MQQPVIRTAAVVVGPFVDDAGAPWSGEVTVTSSTPRVWTATGAVVAPRPVPVALADDGTATLDLPVTDQPGFTDGAGRALTGWTYTVAVALDGAPYARHTFALPSRVAADGPVRLVVLPDAGSVARPVWPALTPPSGGRPAPARVQDRALSRRETFRAGAVALGAAALTGWAASPVAAAPTARAAAAPGPEPVVPALTGAVTLAQVIEEDVTIGSVEKPRTLRIKSSGAGGSERSPDLYDSTGRIVLESYQPHFKWYGESIRVQLKDPRAKGMLAYQAHWPTPHYAGGDFSGRAVHPKDPITIAWIGAHFLDNDDPTQLRNNLRHGHLNFEVPDSRGDLQTRFEIKLIDTTTGRIGTDRSAIRTNLADFEHQVGAAGEQLRIVGNDTRHKDLAFSLEHGAKQPRWVLRAAAGGAQLQFRRYAPGAVHVDSPLQLDPGDGRVLVGGDEGSAGGLVVRRRDGVALSVETLLPGGHGILVSGPAGDPTARVIEGDATGDAIRRFVVQVDGTIAWGDGAAERDTLLYRRGPNQLGTDGGVFLRDSGVPDAAPTGGVLFVQDGALKYRGSAGTVTTLAAA
ncbi:hypothetical protein [Cellulomonas cellasea]|uniref:Uncharacterized protein n=1 Tax=Cellulomonas cellasea TaxID=43670 RepID=A0A7W4YB97_9CELL|nr:hypothetical protein [Cellulomonas cellasea]MBB2922271.1 hypothetical protein [Cellulomonas cellasea]